MDPAMSENQDIDKWQEPRRSGRIKHLNISLPDSFFDPPPEAELAACEGGDEPLFPER